MDIINNYTVYCHTNSINGKKYIGITSIKPEQRWGSNGAGYASSPYFYSAILKYGWNNFYHEIVKTCLSKDEACALEIELIRKMRTTDKKYGYNILYGGTASKMPPEAREKLSQSMLGNKNGLGKPCSEEKKKKIRAAQVGRKLTEEHKRKLSLAKKGKHHAPPSAEVRKKISDSHKKKAVRCVDTGDVFQSIHDCAKFFGLYATNVCACCRGRVKNVKGLRFEYCNE